MFSSKRRLACARDGMRSPSQSLAPCGTLGSVRFTVCEITAVWKHPILALKQLSVVSLSCESLPAAGSHHPACGTSWLDLPGSLSAQKSGMWIVLALVLRHVVHRGV